MKYNINWYLKDLDNIEKKDITVFTTFACGGGSTMGYKLNGLKVKYANDIDPQMQKIYIKNHKPNNYYLCDIRELKEKIPKEIISKIDILDGSPPCSTFSIAGNRDKNWGKEKQFREGQSKQILDDLFFRFLEFADYLKPKIIIAENVKGILQGNAIKYAKNIVKKFNEIGYKVQLFCLNSATMGVPQKRERVFFIASKRELNLPKLKLEFNEKFITFGEIRSKEGKETTEHRKSLLKYYIKTDKCFADIIKRVNGKNSGFTYMILKDNEVTNTLCSGGEDHRAFDGMICSKDDYIKRQSFPLDYDFMGLNVKYICGMSVPPIMMAQIINKILEQWKL